MELRLFCSTRWMSINDDCVGCTVNDFELTQGEGHLDASRFNQLLIERGGTINLTEFLNKPFFYGVTDVETIDHAFQITQSQLTILNQFLNFIWFARDNAINVGHLYGVVPVESFVTQNIKTALYSNSRGGSDSVQITLQDLEHTVAVFKKFQKLSTDDSKVVMPEKDYSAGVVVHDSPYHYKDYNKNNRIEKATSFLTMARAQSLLPLKVSLYMSLLESLFTTDRSEVVHKVAERVALYVGGSFEERIALYRTVKAAYEVRSGFFHGQTIEGKKDKRVNLESTSFGIDEIIRKLMNRVILNDSENFLLPQDEFAEYLHRFVFGRE